MARGLSYADAVRLLTQFAERDVRKAGAALSSAQFEQAVDGELLRLSVVAFAMFNRGRHAGAQ